MLVGADPLHVHDGAGRLVGHPPAEAAEAPAEVEVLDVHEVALVPAADRLERRTPEPQGGARDPLDVAGAVRIDVELAVPAGEAVRGKSQPEQHVTDRVDGRRVGAGRRVLRAVGVPDHRSHRREVGLGVDPGQHRRRRARHHREVGVASPRRPGAVVAAIAAVHTTRVPEVRRQGRPRGPSGSPRRIAATDPSCEPLSTTTTSGAPAPPPWRRRATERTHAAEQERPDS